MYTHKEVTPPPYLRNAVTSESQQVSIKQM